MAVCGTTGSRTLPDFGGECRVVLSSLRDLVHFFPSYPGLKSWAKFFRRFAAWLDSAWKLFGPQRLKPGPRVGCGWYDWKSYSCTVRGSNGPYQGDPFEYLAAYVFQKDLWYIIPAGLVVGQGSIALYPTLKGAKYGPYKEAWHLLRGEIPAGRIEIQACIEGELVEDGLEERVPWGERIWSVLRGRG